MARFLILYEKDLEKPSEWANDRFDFDFLKVSASSFKKAPRFTRDDGVEVYDINWIASFADVEKYDGVELQVIGNSFNGIWGNHSREYKSSFRNKWELNGKKFSIIQYEIHKGVYREYKGFLGVATMTSTRRETEYPQWIYTPDHERTHGYKWRNDEPDYLHMAIKFKNYDNYINSIPKKKVYPLKDWDKVSQPFGAKNKKLYPKTGVHWGVDHAVPVGTPIYAPRDGFLRDDNFDIKELGTNCFYSFKDGKKYYTLVFAHLSKVNKYGEYKKGEIIAYTGNTGSTTAPHSHTEQWKGLVLDRNEIVDKTIDPIKYFS